MQALSVVKHLNIVEYLGSCLITICKARSVYMFLLQRRKEALHRRIVQAIAAPAHGLGDAMPRQYCAVGCGRILGGFKWSSQHDVRSLTEVTVQTPRLVFSRQASFAVGR